MRCFKTLKAFTACTEHCALCTETCAVSLCHSEWVCAICEERYTLHPCCRIARFRFHRWRGVSRSNENCNTYDDDYRSKKHAGHCNGSLSPPSLLPVNVQADLLVFHTGDAHVALRLGNNNGLARRGWSNAHLDIFHDALSFGVIQ